tara:strand:- start:20 stop:589 length:570 start_codon:yes stop_codon:yes gene_type:complete
MIKAIISDYAFELVEVNAKLDEALNKVTKEMCMGMDYGDMIELNDTYTLSKHSEDDMWSIYLTEDWDEICAVIIGILSKDGNHQDDIISFDLVEYKAKWSDYKESEIDLLDNAHNKITSKMLDEMGYGQSIILNKRFTLYKYYDMDYFVLRDEKYEDEETFTVQYGYKDDVILTEFYGYDDNEDFCKLK